MKRRADRQPAAAAVSTLPGSIAPRMVGVIPALYGIYEISVIYGISVASVRRGLQAGTFRPEPWDKYPYRWRPADIEADLAKPRNLRMRNHGRWGAHRLRTAKVATPTNGDTRTPKKKAK